VEGTHQDMRRKMSVVVIVLVMMMVNIKGKLIAPELAAKSMRSDVVGV
jgi:hypothetical protein